MDILPYNRALEAQERDNASSCGSTWENHQFLGFSALERSASAGIAQRLEHLVYTQGVAGSNPASRTILLSGKSGLSCQVDEEDLPLLSLFRWYPLYFPRCCLCPYS